MKQLLIDTLATLGYPVHLQGTLNPDESYPESFITFWTNYTNDNEHFDNGAVAVDWEFSVIFYSTSPTLVNTVPNAIRTALKGVGFIPQGKGNDIPSDEPTHTGWAMDFIIRETL